MLSLPALVCLIVLVLPAIAVGSLHEIRRLWSMWGSCFSPLACLLRVLSVYAHMCVELEEVRVQGILLVQDDRRRD